MLTISERWAGEGALKDHFESDHMAAFNKAVDGAVWSIDAKKYDAGNERPIKLA